jgi:hypothetical protein
VKTKWPKKLLVSGIVILLLAAVFFWTNARLTHLNCCSQTWVESAQDPQTRDMRARARAMHLAEIARIKRESFAFSLSSLAAALGLSGIHYLINKGKKLSRL